MASQTSLTDQQFMRYSRQIMLPSVAEHGQLQLLNSKVCIIGVGGLGQQVAQLLAAAGVGDLCLIDPDKVALDNLPRQTLYRDIHIGLAKALVAARKLRQRYSDCHVSAIVDAFTAEYPQKTTAWLHQRDLVIDCSDNFACRHALSHTTLALNKPLLSAAVAGDQGWLALFHPDDVAQAGCFHCLFPSDTQTQQNCAAMGVMGSAVATVASLQADMALRYLTQQLTPELRRKLLHINFATLQFRQAARTHDPHCDNCALPLRKCS